MKVNKIYGELEVSARLARELGGVAEVDTVTGRIDVLTDTEVIEVKRLEGWKGGLGQLSAYGLSHPHHQQRLHLLVDVNEKNSQRKIETVKATCDQLGVILTWEIVKVVRAKPKVASQPSENKSKREVVNDDDLFYFMLARKRLHTHPALSKLLALYGIEVSIAEYRHSITIVQMMLVQLDQIESVLHKIENLVDSLGGYHTKDTREALNAFRPSVEQIVSVLARVSSV